MNLSAAKVYLERDGSVDGKTSEAPMQPVLQPRQKIVGVCG
jgi:hypothetical protein